MLAIQTRFLAPTAAAPFGLCVTGGEARAESFRHIDRLATQLEGQAESAHKEVHAHFHNNPMYRHLDNDISGIEKLARHIHELVHHGGSQFHLSADVRNLDQQVHHAQGVLRQAARYRALNREAYAHISRDLERMEDTVHHLRSDLEDLGHDHHHR